MNSRSVGPLLGILFALFTLVWVSEASAQAAPAITCTADGILKCSAPEEKKSHWCFDRQLDTFASAVGTPPIAIDGKPGGQSADVDDPDVSHRMDEISSKLGSGVEVLIATVPDPIDSGFQYFFDTTIEALQTGIEATGYYRDQSWLPWVDRTLIDPAGNARAQACRWHVPGVILFRAAHGASGARNRVVLLVGETPTWGVQSQALRAALTFANRLAGQTTVKILGPWFSGGAPSLRRGIEAFCSNRDCPDFQITTGTATSTGSAKVFAGSPLRLIYRAATIPDDHQQCAMYALLINHGVECMRRERVVDCASCQPDADSLCQLERVAMLREAGTAYGRSGSPGALCGFEPEVEIDFPLHVSSVRDAYDLSEEADRARRSESRPGRRTALSASLSERSKARDTESEPSPKTTYAEDTILAHLLSELANEGIRYAGVLASDSADAIFLSRKVRDVAPDVRLFLFGADILFHHPTYQRDLFGSYVVSAYPFFGADDFSHGPARRHRHLPFESSLAQGVYNAALLSFGNREALEEYNFFGTGSAAIPGEDLPIWITAIGRSGPAPITAVKSCDEIADRRINTNVDCDRGLGKGNGTRPNSAPERTWTLHVDPDVTPPVLWQAVLVSIALFSLLDGRAMGARMTAFEKEVRDARAATKCDHAADRVAAVTAVAGKIAFYDVVRKGVAAVGLGYMVLVQRLALATYSESRGVDNIIPMLVMVLGLIALADSLRRGAMALSLWFRRTWQLTELFQSEVNSTTSGDTIGSRRVRRMWPVFRACGRSASYFLRGNRERGRIGMLSESLAHSVAVGVAFAAVGAGLAFGAVTMLTASRETLAALVGLRQASDPGTAMAVLRALPLLSGVSPSAPLLLALLSLGILVTARMARLGLVLDVTLMTPEAPSAFLDGAPLPLTFLLGGPAGGKTARATPGPQEERFMSTLLRPTASPAVYVSILSCVSLPVALFILRRPSTFENTVGSVVLLGLLAFVAVTLLGTLLQFLTYWRAFRDLSGTLLTLSISPAFAWVARPLAEPVDKQVSKWPNDTLRASVVLEIARRLSGLVGAFVPEHGGPVDNAGVALDQALREDDEHARRHHRDRATRLLLAYGAAVYAALERQLARGGDVLVKDGEPSGASDGLPGEGATGDEDRPHWNPFSIAEPKKRARAKYAAGYVTTCVALVLNRHVRQVRYFVSGMTGAAVALLLAVVLYAFQPHRLFLTCIWGLVGAGALSSLVVYLDLERNALLSRISRTPSRVVLDTSLVLRVLTWVVLPLLSVAAVQYPQLGNTIFSWIEPFTRVLR